MTGLTRTASVATAMNKPTKPKLRLDTAGDANPVRGEMAGMDLGMRVLSYLIAGVLVYGGLGWVGDHFLGTSFLLPTGIILGAAGGCYIIIRRFGQVPDVHTNSVTPTGVDRATNVDTRATNDDKTATISKTEGAR